MKSEFLRIAIESVKAAEKVILKYLDAGVRVELKADMSPVTIADRQAEETIKRVIRAKFPDHTFYGEEGNKTSLENHKGYTWIIDPIDGTKSYIRGNPVFATQLALMHDGELVIGVSNAPLLNELVYAEKGQGCFLNDKKITVSCVDDIGESYISYGSLKYFVARDYIQDLLSLTENARWARGIGDFWGYHLLAQGKVDVMVEADIKLWDIAAVKVIIEEAGGRVSQIDGSPVDHTTTTFLATNGKLHSSVLQKFKTSP